jgi:hypothetical protein
MRKTTAGKIVIGLVNVAFVVILATAVVSVVPPAYNFTPGTVTITSISPSVSRVSMSYTVTNNGFYAIDNFYVEITVVGPTGVTVGENQTTPITIQRGTTPAGTILADLNQTSINLHHGVYQITLLIHSEFAFRLLKLTVSVPANTTL